MALGPGKYDAEVTDLMQRLKAQGIILIVFGGDRGHGFSAQLTFDQTVKMPALLREVAKQIEDSSGGRA